MAKFTTILNSARRRLTFELTTGCHIIRIDSVDNLTKLQHQFNNMTEQDQSDFIRSMILSRLITRGELRG